MAHGLWDIGGTFVLPGGRDKVSFGPVRVSAASKQIASQHVAPLLQVAFGKDAKGQDRRPYRFGAHFALLNLTFREVKVREELPLETAV